jgi:hypothetical protein
MTLLRPKSLVIALLGTAALACGGAPAPGEPIALPSGTPVEFTRLRAEPYSFTYYSGMKQPARIVVRDALTWRSVWTQIWSGTSPVPDLPPVDFTREMIVVAALGEHSSGGYGILVEAAVMGEHGLTVQVQTDAPGRSCMTTAAFSQPVDVARFPLVSGAVRFVDDPITHECN